MDTVFLEGRVLASHVALGIPWALEVNDSDLWVSDHAGDPFVHLLNAQSGAFRHSVGRRGDGPGEFAGRISRGQVLRAAPGGIARYFDVSRQRVTFIDPADPAPGSETRTISLRSDPAVQRVVWIHADRVVGIARSEDSRFQIFDSTGTLLERKAGPLLGTADHPIEARLRASAGTMNVCAREDGSGFVLIYGAAGRVEFYDSSADLELLADVPDPQPASFGVSEQTRQPVHRPTTLHYMTCTVAGNRLYALYSGRGWNEPTAGNIIHVFDASSGRLTAVLKVDTDIVGITVDDGGRHLYGVSDATASIYMYDLPDHLDR